MRRDRGLWLTVGLIVVLGGAAIYFRGESVRYHRQLKRAREDAAAAVVASPAHGVPMGKLDALGVHVDLSQKQIVAVRDLFKGSDVADGEISWQRGDPLGVVRLTVTYYCWSDLAGLAGWRIAANGRARITFATGPTDEQTGDQMCANGNPP
jgi:hypothetical protein